MEQRSAEWHAARLGKVTASKVADVMAKTKSGYSTSRENYMIEIALQRITKKAKDGFTNAAMQRGTDLEPIARSAYESSEGVMVIECGLIDHPEVKSFAASPDGLVGTDGLLEIKCPDEKQHFAFLRSMIPDNKYQIQMLAQMACTGRKWCDFVSFDDRFPIELQYAKMRFMRDDKRISEMLSEITSFLEEVKEAELEIHAMINRIKEAA